MGKITKKARFRDLFTDHFENAQKETKVWKPQVENRIENEGKKINKFKDVVEFIDVNMQTAIRVSYDYTKTLDENLESYKMQKKVQDESDQVNFLRQPAAGLAVEEALTQSIFWYNQKRGFGNGDKVWMPSKFRADTAFGAQSKK